MNIWQRIALIILSSLLVILAIEPFAFSILALVAWIPFFIAIRGATFRAAFRLGVLQGFLTFAGTLIWLYEIFGALAPILWLMLALFTGLFAGLSTLPRLKNSPALVALVWTGIEYYRAEHFYLNFSWITPGTALPPNLFTSIIGVYGVSFLIILASLWLAHQRWRHGIPLALLIIIAVMAMSHRINHSAPSTVALIQNEKENFDYYVEVSSPLKAEVDVIVWPEYAISFDPTHEMNAYALKDISTLLDSRAQLLVAGGKTWHDTTNHIWSNTAFTFGKEGVLGTHFKNHTVHMFDDGEKGTTASAIETPIGKIGTPICFDCDHQDVIRRMTADGAGLFLIPSMDAIKWTERQHLQHGTLFRHRAAENGRWLAVASTSGLTQIIGPNGYADKKLPLMDEGVLIGEVSILKHRTLFQRGGWLFGPISLAVTVGLILWSIFLALRKKTSASEKADLQESPQPPS